MYLGDFSSQADVLEQFKLKESDLEGVEILFAWYNYECYEGDAFVLFRRDGKLFEVNGSHCSCYGLEDQWGPEETTFDAVAKREWYSLWRDSSAAKAKEELDKLLVKLQTS